jgi:DNA-binding transcriptional LysR family regulator
MLMTFDQLRILVTIADTGSILAAAASLNRTQPTLSVSIRKLETALGLQLLARDQYRASLTPQGEAICRQARLVLQQTGSLARLATLLAEGHEPVLRIAIEASCPMAMVMGVFRSCQRKYPATEFTLMAENIRGALERLENEEADLVITPWFEENLAFESFRLADTVLTAVAAPGFMVGKGGGHLTIDDLREVVQIVVHDSSKRPSPYQYGIIEEGRRWLVHDHETKKKIILAGMGWGRLQRHMIETELADGGLVELQIDQYPQTLALEIRVARRRQLAHGPVADDLWNAFQTLANPSARD